MRKASHNSWEQIKEEIILLCVQWYLIERLSYPQLKAIMQQRGFKVDPRTINNLVSEFSVLAMKRFKETEKRRKRGWRLVQIPFKMGNQKKYLYRALDAQGNTLDFMITGNRSKEKVKLFFEQTISKNSQNIATKIPHKKPRLSTNNSSLIRSIFIIVLFSTLGIFVFDRIARYTENNNNNNQIPHDSTRLEVYPFTGKIANSR